MVAKSTVHLAIVAAIIVIAVTVVISVVNQQNAEIEKENAEIEAQYQYCQNWSDQLDQRLARLQARQSSFGGSIDWNGDVEAERLSFNAEIGQYNAECAS